MSKGIGLALVLLVAGCGQTPFGDQMRDMVKQRGVMIMDQGLTNSEWFMCEGASVGSIKRRYGGTKVQAYKDLCATNSVEDLFEKERLSFPSGFPEVLREGGTGE